jgi:hypothetical protein
VEILYLVYGRGRDRALDMATLAQNLNVSFNFKKVNIFV